METCSFLELLRSGSAPIKPSFYKPPCMCVRGCVYVITGIYNTFRHHSGPTFSNAISRSLDPLGLWFDLKLVCFGFENIALLFSTNWLPELACFPQTLLLAAPIALGFVYNLLSSPGDLPSLSTFSSFDHCMCKVVYSVGNKTLPVSSKTKRMNQVQLCQIWKALMNLNLQYLSSSLLIWLCLHGFLSWLHFYAVHLSRPLVSQFVFLCLILLSLT